MGLWFNLTEVSPGDNIIIEWWSPSGDLYKLHNWTAPSWVQHNSDWDIWEDMEIMGPARLSDVEQAQLLVIQAARKLEAEGRIIISGRGGEDLVA